MGSMVSLRTASWSHSAIWSSFNSSFNYMLWERLNRCCLATLGHTYQYSQGNAILMGRFIRYPDGAEMRVNIIGKQFPQCSLTFLHML